MVAGTDAAATVLPHLARQLISLHAQRADVAAQAGDPGGWPTLMCQVLTTRARDQGSRPPPSLLAETLGKDLRHRSPAGLLLRARSRHRPLRLIDPWQGASPTAATRGSSAPCSPPPSPHCAPTPSPRPTTSANATKANRLGPGRPRPGPPPHPDPARHDPQRRTLRTPTSHETTHRRLTHHIGAPPESPVVLALEEGAGKESRAVPNPKGRRAHVRKGKVTARKVSDILNSIARLVRAVGVLVDALSKWIG